MAWSLWTAPLPYQAADLWSSEILTVWPSAVCEKEKQKYIFDITEPPSASQKPLSHLAFKNNGIDYLLIYQNEYNILQNDA
jgi:hypothetical protein